MTYVLPFRAMNRDSRTFSLQDSSLQSVAFRGDFSMPRLDFEQNPNSGKHTFQRR